MNLLAFDLMWDELNPISLTRVLILLGRFVFNDVSL